MDNPEAVRLEGKGSRRSSHEEIRLCGVLRYSQRLWLVLENHLPYV